MKKLPLTILVLLLLFTAGAGSSYGQACKTSMIWDQLVTPSPPYKACAPWMKTTFTATIASPGGYSLVWCQVIGTPFSDIYYANGPAGPFEAIAWTYCPNLNNHQLLMDVQPTLPPETGFVGPYTLKAEYFNSSPTGPQGP